MTELTYLGLTYLALFLGFSSLMLVASRADRRSRSARQGVVMVGPRLDLSGVHRPTAWRRKHGG